MMDGEGGGGREGYRMYPEKKNRVTTWSIRALFCASNEQVDEQVASE